MSLGSQSLFRGSLLYVIGGRLLVHCTEGNCSLEVPLSEVYLYMYVCRYETSPKLLIATKLQCIEDGIE